MLPQPVRHFQQWSCLQDRGLRAAWITSNLSMFGLLTRLCGGHQLDREKSLDNWKWIGARPSNVNYSWTAQNGLLPDHWLNVKGRQLKVDWCQPINCHLQLDNWKWIGARPSTYFQLNHWLISRRTTENGLMPDHQLYLQLVKREERENNGCWPNTMLLPSHKLEICVHNSALSLTHEIF